MDIVPLLILVAGGFTGGFFGSAVGSAGLVSLPILILMGFTPHAAIATTRPAAVVLEGVSALRYARDGKISRAMLKRGLLLGIFGAVGGVLGAIFITQVSDQTLRLVLSIVILTMLLFLLTNKHWGMHEHPHKQKNLIGIAVTTLVVGLYGGLFGFTFGTLMTIALVLFGHTLLQGAVLARIVGTMVSLASGVVFAYHGSIRYPESIALAIGFGLGAWIGAGVTSRKGNGYVKALLVAVVVISVAKLIADYVRGA